MTRIPLGASSPEGVATALSTFAQITANNSQNWENYEGIVLDVMKQIWAAARPVGIPSEYSLVLAEAARMRAAIDPALGAARGLGACQECGFGQNGEYEAIAAFDKAALALPTSPPKVDNP